jgi:hypothetical protein
MLDVSGSVERDTRVPTRIRGTQQCQHIFGSSCFKSWIDSDSEQSNTRPMCREELFLKPPPPEPLCICKITNVEHAWDYIYMLRGRCIDAHLDFRVADGKELWSCVIWILMRASVGLEL